MFDYRDREGIEEIAIKNLSATIIVRIPKDIEIQWSKFDNLISKYNIIFALEDINMYKECKLHKVKYYWAYPITSFYELEGIVALGVCQILIGAPLFFDLFRVQSFGKDIRVVANNCFDNYIPRENGICGVYIRPEDVQYYEDYISTIEFYTTTNQKEASLLKIYKEDQKWPGNLNLLLTNFNCNVDNRAIPEEFALARMQCRQTCMGGGKCKFCYTAVNFSRAIDKAKKDWLKNNA